MSKHRERVQLRRKRGARNSENTGYGAALIDIYRRALQGGSDAYLITNQQSEPDRVAKIQHEAQERRDRRGNKARILRPRSRPAPTSESAPKSNQYARLSSGQIIGHPRPMRDVKADARRARLERRANFRERKASHAPAWE